LWRGGQDPNGTAVPAEEPAGEERLDEERDDRAARVHRGVEQGVGVLRILERTGLRRAVEPCREQVVRDLHEEVPEEDVHAERAQERVPRDELVAAERSGEALPQALPLVLLLQADRALTLRQVAAVRH